MTAAVQMRQVSKQFHNTLALQECTTTLPVGSIAALVGLNGAGKSTLLRLMAGLLVPTTGTLTVFGNSPIQVPRLALDRIGYVAQSHPLYAGFTIEEMLILGKKLNRKWDNPFARARVRDLGLNFKKRIGQLSGGQQAQVALIMALAKRPQLLLLDEPLASLDPLARRQFLNVILDAALANGMTIVLSSHMLSDLERVCDHLLILANGRIQCASPIDEVIRTHKRLVGDPSHITMLAHLHHVLEAQQSNQQATVIVRLDGPLFDPTWELYNLSLEEIVLAYLGQKPGQEMPQASPLQPMEA